MKFGIFDHIDDAGVPLSQLYADRLTIAEAYDRAGFHGYHVAEHHTTPLGAAASPALIFAALAYRTTTLRFGPLVYLLPFYHPLRLIEEVCMLDQMSGGRFSSASGAACRCTRRRPTASTSARPRRCTTRRSRCC